MLLKLVLESALPNGDNYVDSTLSMIMELFWQLSGKLAEPNMHSPALSAGLKYITLYGPQAKVNTFLIIKYYPFRLVVIDNLGADNSINRVINKTGIYWDVPDHQSGNKNVLKTSVFADWSQHLHETNWFNSCYT